MWPRIRVSKSDQLARSLAQTRYHGVQFPGHGRRRLSGHHDRGRAACTGCSMCHNGLANRGKAGIEIVVKHEYGFNVAGIVVVQRSGQVLGGVHVESPYRPHHGDRWPALVTGLSGHGAAKPGGPSREILFQ